MDDGRKIIRAEYRELQDKRAYFLLGAAGACVGFSVTQMDELVASAAIVLLLSSLALSGLSILAGLRVLGLEERVLEANDVFLQLPSNADATIREAWRQIADEQAFGPLGRAKGRWSQIQMGSLFIGGFLLPLWKLAECPSCLAAVGIR